MRRLTRGLGHRPTVRHTQIYAFSGKRSPSFGLHHRARHLTFGLGHRRANAEKPDLSPSNPLPAAIDMAIDSSWEGEDESGGEVALAQGEEGGDKWQRGGEAGARVKKGAARRSRGGVRDMSCSPRTATTKNAYGNLAHRWRPSLEYALPFHCMGPKGRNGNSKYMFCIGEGLNKNRRRA